MTVVPFEKSPVSSYLANMRAVTVFYSLPMGNLLVDRVDTILVHVMSFQDFMDTPTLHDNLEIFCSKMLGIDFQDATFLSQPYNAEDHTSPETNGYFIFDRNGKLVCTVQPKTQIEENNNDECETHSWDLMNEPVKCIYCGAQPPSLYKNGEGEHHESHSD